MKRTALVCLLVVALALTVVSAMAQGRRGMGPPMAPPANPPITCQSILGLSQAQVGEMDRMRAAFVKDTEGLRTELQTRQQEILKLWAASVLDVDLIKAKAHEADRIASQLRDKAIDLHAAMLGILTPEQRTKCAQCCLSGQRGMGCGMGMGMGPGGPGLGTCPMTGGCGMGMGPGGPGMGMGPGPRGCGMGMGPNGAGCPTGLGPTGTGCPLVK